MESGVFDTIEQISYFDSITIQIEFLQFCSVILYPPIFQVTKKAFEVNLDKHININASARILSEKIILILAIFVMQFKFRNHFRPTFSKLFKLI